ncbi:MAG: hypothetical protein K2P78_06265, partial [Gemmataceae bacterium]|nr:hypothetical protein [Gemmataceae bacterium]
MEPAAADLARIRELYTQGRYRQAYDLTTAFGPIRGWTGTAARLIGGRLAIQLGAPNLGRRLHLAAFRSTPAHPEAIYYHARYRLERFGPLSAWRFMRANPDWSDAPPELRADWLSLHGFVAARLRDFDRAERWLNRADAVAPNRPWPCVERASAYELADRLDDALASSRRALELQPWFRPGVQAAAHVLLRLGRDREALDLLAEAATHIESGLVLAQLSGLQNDRGRHADAARSLDRYAELSPLMEDEVRKWLAARRADTAYPAGDLAAAAAHARDVGEEFYTAFADRLSTGEPRAPARGLDIDPVAGAPPGNPLAGAPPGNPLAGARCSPRVILPVDLGYDRTPPAVHDLLARHGKAPLPAPGPDAGPPADALPDAAERQRFAQAGWQAVEFTLTAEAAFDLIGRGVPFLVTLVEAGYAQARLVVGADRLKQTLFLADGTDRKPLEGPLSTVLERFAFAGPRCLAVVPPNESAPLDGFAPPDATAHDLLFAVQRPLLAHDRPAAAAALARLHAEFPGHRLAKLGELALARYDAHPVRTLRALDALL